MALLNERSADRAWHSPLIGALTALLGTLAVIAVLIGATPGHAQSSPANSAQASADQGGEVTPAQAENLLATLEDDAAREEFVQKLRDLVEAHETLSARSATEESAAVEPAAEEPTAEAPSGEVAAGDVGTELLGTLAGSLDHLAASITAVIEAAADFSNFSEWAQQQVDNPASRARWIDLFLDLGLALGIGIAAGLLLMALLRSPRRKVEEREFTKTAERVTNLTMRTILDLLPLAAFTLAAYAVLGALEPNRAVRNIVPAVINAGLFVGAVIVITRALLAPYASNLRLIKLADSPARYLFRWVRRLAIIIVFGYLVSEVGVPLGLAPPVRDGLLSIVALLVAGIAIFLVIRHRNLGASVIRGESISQHSSSEDGASADGEAEPPARRRSLLSFRNRLADVWHVLAIVYVVVAYGVWMHTIPGGFSYMLRASGLSILIVIVAHFVSVAARGAVSQILGEQPGEDADRTDREKEQTGPLYRIVEALIFIIAVLSLLEVWGIGIVGYLQEDAGRRLLSSFLAAAAVLVVAFFCWVLVRSWVERQLEKVERSHESPAQKARMRTLLPLLRNAALVALITVATLIALSEIGINIAPLLAGAGVVGLAIGFGAQTLVKDVITGLFNLFENTIAVGDVVNVAGNGGLVEGMTIRTVRLRDLSGNVYTIPFSEVTTVMNMTRDFSYYVFNIGVAYREDVDEVIGVIKDLGAELQEDPDYSHLILEPIEVLGVDAFADSAVVIKARFKTTPINQWTVGREYNRRMKKRFDELGIEIPFPHMTLYFGEDKQGAAPAGPIRVTATEIAEALASGNRGADGRNHQRPPSPEDAESARTSPQIGNSAAESTLGHDET